MALLRRARPVRRVLPAVAAGAAATVLLPDVLRVDRRLPLLAAVAWRPQAVAATALVAGALSAWRPARPTAAALGAVAGAGAVAVAARVPRRTTAEPRPDDLTVLALNVLVGRADTGAVAALLEREAPDLVVLPEAGHDYLDKLTPLVSALGYRGWSAAPAGYRDIKSVVVLGGPRAGDLQIHHGTDLRYRYLRVSGGILGSRDLVAVHAAAPRRRRLTLQWRRDLELVGTWTRARPTPIVVGDFNATLDNAPLRAALGGCVPAAAGVDALVGTFPAALPRWFGIHIDHVLVPAGTAVVRFSVVDVAGTDHRGVLARLRLPDGSGDGG